jgi:hypothetical protein
MQKRGLESQLVTLSRLTLDARRSIAGRSSSNSHSPCLTAAACTAVWVQPAPGPACRHPTCNTQHTTTGNNWPHSILTLLQGLCRLQVAGLFRRGEQADVVLQYTLEVRPLPPWRLATNATISVC